MKRQMKQKESEDDRVFKLVIRQHPKHARMCGFGEKDRRPIDSPPIIQLIITDKQGNSMKESLENGHFVMHASLYSTDLTEEQNIIFTPPAPTRVLTGSLVSSMYLLTDLDGNEGAFFVFPDLSVRIEGTYRLKFSLIETGLKASKIRDIIYSDEFSVYPAKKFPGMTQSSQLSLWFSKQGLRIPVRREARAKKPKLDE